MGDRILQRSFSAALWNLVELQHGVVSRRQLRELGYSPKAIAHRISAGRLHPVHRGVYAVGRPQLTAHGKWMAAVLCCGPEAVLSHASAAALWKIGAPERGPIEVSIPLHVARRPAGITVHRRVRAATVEATRCDGIRVTTPICTLIDIAPRLGRDPLEAAINEADKLGLTDPEELRSALAKLAPRPGFKPVRETLDRRTFTLTDSELERRFLPLVQDAGLPRPETGRRVNGFEVDFYWPALGLVVETDGLRYHRTPAQQTRDRIRDQAHAAAGLTPLRFTRAQVRFEPAHVQATLSAVVRRLERAA